jgi:hypothetical protein
MGAMGIADAGELTAIAQSAIVPIKASFMLSSSGKCEGQASSGVQSSTSGTPVLRGSSEERTIESHIDSVATRFVGENERWIAQATENMNAIFSPCHAGPVVRHFILVCSRASGYAPGATGVQPGCIAPLPAAIGGRLCGSTMSAAEPSQAEQGVPKGIREPRHVGAAGNQPSRTERSVAPALRGGFPIQPVKQQLDVIVRLAAFAKAPASPWTRGPVEALAKTGPGDPVFQRR